MGKKRSQAEVDALWPKDKVYYTMGAAVTLPATNNTKAASIIQQMYEGEGAVAGMFDVRKLIKKGSFFVVVFQRDVSNDSEVVNDALLCGRDFNKVLIDQFMSEAKAAIASKNLPIKITLVDSPKFSAVPIKG